MFSKVALFVAITMAVFVAAAPQKGSCNTGPVQCCNSEYEKESEAGAALLAAAGINIQDVTGTVRSNCNPITAVGAGNGAKWLVFFSLASSIRVDIVPHSNSQPVCCSDNKFSELTSVSIICNNSLTTFVQTVPLFLDVRLSTSEW